MNMSAVLLKTEDILDAEVGDSAVLLSITTGKYIELNQFGLAIWKALDAKPTGSEVVNMMMEQFETAESACEADVAEFVERLLQNNLVKFE